MNIAIIGGGAIGLLTGYYLAEQHDVTIYVKREEQKEKLLKNGIHLYIENNFTAKRKVKAAHLSQLGESDVIIICVKQSVIDHIFIEIKELLQESHVIFLQNGMGHVPLMCDIQQSFAGIVEHGAVRMSDYKVNHLGQGLIKLAQVNSSNDELLALCKALHVQIYPFVVHSNWELMLKEKLIINAVINPLTALFDVSNHAVVTNEAIKILAKKLCEETATVLNLDVNIYWEKVVDVARKTGNNTSSMRNDIKKGRLSENEAISGYIVHQAAVDVPFTTFVYYSIIALESRET